MWISIFTLWNIILFSLFISSIFFESLKSKSTQMLRPQKGNSEVSFKIRTQKHREQGHQVIVLFSILYMKQLKILWNIDYICVKKIYDYRFNIWMISLELNWFVYDPSWILQLSEFVWTLRSSVWGVFNNFLLIEATV